MAHELTVNRDLCMGSGHCCYYAPNTFDLDETTVAVVIDPNGDSEEAIRKAITFCPTHAITSVEISSD